GAARPEERASDGLNVFGVFLHHALEGLERHALLGAVAEQRVGVLRAALLERPGVRREGLVWRGRLARWAASRARHQKSHCQNLGKARPGHVGRYGSASRTLGQSARVSRSTRRGPGGLLVLWTSGVVVLL